jgi:aldehyde dehydrogenase (NAD+)
MDITQLVSQQRAYYNTGITHSVAFRRHALEKLAAAIRSNEDALCAAMHTDLNKAPFESYMCEVGLVLDELDYAIKNLSRWARPRRVKTPLSQFYARSFTVPEPLGVTLIMSPWNYPFLLTMDPLIGALAAGNCAVVKPSDYSAATSAAMAKLLAECFPPEYVAVVQGGRAQRDRFLMA